MGKRAAKVYLRGGHKEKLKGVHFLRCAGNTICNEILVPRNGTTEWARLTEPLPFFDGFKHFLQVVTPKQEL